MSILYIISPSYIHVGRDIGNYHPKFACQPESIITSKVGLLRGEEVFAAGGFWQKENKKYFLYNPDLPPEVPQTSWTISASYYSISEKQAGVITYNQYIDDNAKGSIFDWVRGGNLAQNYGYRPVITINGNVKIHGTGTKTDPYVIIK